MRKAVYVRIRIYYCPRWRPGGGFLWALRTHFLWLSSTGRWQADIFFFFLFFDTGGEKGGGRVARLAWMHFPSLSASVAGLKRVSAAGWMSCGHWPVVKKRPASHGGSRVFFFFFFLSFTRGTAETSQMQKCGGEKKKKSSIVEQHVTLLVPVMDGGSQCRSFSIPTWLAFFFCVRSYY